MRVGPFNISRLADRPRLPAEQRDEIGATGTVVSSGQILEADYNTDLVGLNALNNYDKMRKGDGTVAAVLAACTLPIRGATWTVEPASEDKADVEIAEFVSDNLFNMTLTWDDFLRQALLMLSFGYYPFEKVWEVRDDNRIWLRKLAPRLPRTITKWLLDEEGGLAGIEQMAWKAEEMQTVQIDVAKLLVFVLNKEGSNFQGISLLRPAYKHWWYKDKLYRIDAIAAERHGTGVPVGEVKADDVSAAELVKAEAALMALHTHQKAYLLEPSHRIGFRIEDMKGGALKNVIASAEHHDIQITRSVLAEFLNLGATTQGSWALARDKSSFFIMSLRAIAHLAATTIDLYLIRQLVDYNFSGVKDYPTLAYSNLETRLVKDISQAVSQLMDAGALTPNRETEEALRRDLDLPELPEEEAPTTAPAKPKTGPVEPEEGEETDLDLSDLSEVERLADFADMERTLDKGRDRLAEVMLALQERQIAKLVDVILPLIKKQNTDRLAEIDVPYKRELAQPSMAILRDLFKAGRLAIRGELGRQGLKLAEPMPGQDVANINGYIAARVGQTSRTMAARLHNAASYTALGQIRTGQVDEGLLAGALRKLSPGVVKRAAADLANEAFGLGRGHEASKQPIEKAVYSAIMDKGTCEACASVDRQEFDVGSQDFAAHEPPYQQCAGHGMCRCIYIYLLAERRTG